MVADLGDTIESARTIGHTSARSARVEVLPHAERRRFWTAEQKLAIVGESLGAELTPTEVARKHRISTGQIYTWRQQLLGGEGSSVSRTVPRFTAVELAPTCAPSHLGDSGAKISARAAGSAKSHQPVGSTLSFRSDELPRNAW